MSVTSKELDALKKRLDAALGSHANLLGVKAQQFDKKNIKYDQRQQQSFNIEVARIADVAYSSSSKCTLEELGNSRTKIYYTGKKPDYVYHDLITRYAEKAASWGLVAIKDGSLENLQNNTIVITEKCGDYLKKVHSDRIFSLKAHQIRCLNILGQIINTYPDTQEIDFEEIDISKPLGISLVSMLETLAVVKTLPSGKIVPSPVFEVHSEKALDALDDALTDQLSRHILMLIHKMPGISLGKMASFIPKLSESQFEKFEKITTNLVDHHVVVVFPGTMDDEKYIVPLWTVSKLLKISNNLTVIEPDMLRRLFAVSSPFWDGVSDLSKLDEQIMVMRAHLIDLKGKRCISLDELIQLGNPYSQLVKNLSRIGVLKIDGEELTVVKEKTHLISAIIEILTSSLTAEFEPLHSQSLSNEQVKEYDDALKIIFEEIQDKLSPNDLQKFKGLKE